MAARLRGLKKSRAGLIGQFINTSGHVYNRFLNFNPGEMDDSYFNFNFRDSFTELESLARQVTDFKFTFGEMKNEILDVIKLTEQFTIGIDVEEFLGLLETVKESTKPKINSDYYQLFFGQKWKN